VNRTAERGSSRGARPSFAHFGLFLRTVLDQGGRSAYAALALTLAVSLTEGIGLLLLVPLLALAGVDVGVGSAAHLQQIAVGALARVGLAPTLPLVLSVYVLVVSARVLLQRAQSIESARLGVGVAHTLRARIHAAVTNMEWSAFVTRRSSDIVHALTTELDRVSAAANQLPQMATQALLAVVYTAVALRVSPTLAAVSCASGLVLLIALRGTTRTAHRAGEAFTVASRELASATQEQTASLKVTRSFGAAERNRQRFVEASGRVGTAYLEYFRAYSASGAWFGIASVVLLSILVYLSVATLRLSAATILLLLFLFARLVPRFSDLQRNWQFLVTSLPAFDTIATLIRDAEAHAEAPAVPGPPIPIRSAVELRDVWFEYPRTEGQQALRGVNLCVAHGSLTALVGPSGAGKSTVADILLGILAPARGELVVDGTTLRPEDRDRWRGSIAYVPQDAFLLHDTIRANLRWADPGATDEQLWAALRKAAADAFVTRLPGGLDTVVGDRGLLLSGGERQRIALARAFLRDPSLLVLDEATSSLDPESERQMLAAIAELRGRTTVLMITHRLQAVRTADEIYVLDRGRVAQSGDWRSLAAEQDGLLAQLIGECAER
jgi:ATP-binding cassette subfamily C protein